MAFKAVIINMAMASILAVTCLGQTEKKEPPVRAKEPTVVTVHGSREKVDTNKSESEAGLEKKPNPFRRVVNGVGRTFSAVGHGISHWLNSTFDDDDVVPSSREDRGREDRKREDSR
jgi:hypothetical protein